MHSNKTVCSNYTTSSMVPAQPPSCQSQNITSPIKPATNLPMEIPCNPSFGSPITPVTSPTKYFPSPTTQVTEDTTYTKFEHPYIPTYSTPSCKSQYVNAAQSLLKTVDFKLEDLKSWAILDSGVTSHFLITNAPVIDIIPVTTPMVVQIINGDVSHQHIYAI